MNVEIKSKAELWDYYQELVKAAGFDGITGLLAENTRLQSLINSSIEAPDAIKLLQRVASTSTASISAPKPMRCCSYWRNDAIESAAHIADRYDQKYCAQDIRNMKRPSTDTLEQSPAVAVPDLDSVEGDILPPVGSSVAIHLASCDKWVDSRVVGYYVWGPLGGIDSAYSRVFVRVVDSQGILNARLLKDVKCGKNTELRQIKSPRITEQDSDGYVCGDNYAAGLWSRKNIEAFVDDGNRVGGVTEQDINQAIGKLEHVLKMNENAMTGTGVAYVEECIALLTKLNAKPESVKG